MSWFTWFWRILSTSAHHFHSPFISGRRVFTRFSRSWLTRFGDVQARSSLSVKEGCLLLIVEWKQKLHSVVADCVGIPVTLSSNVRRVFKIPVVGDSLLYPSSYLSTIIGVIQFASSNLFACVIYQIDMMFCFLRFLLQIVLFTTQVDVLLHLHFHMTA